MRGVDWGTVGPLKDRVDHQLRHELKRRVPYGCLLYTSDAADE